MEKLVAMMAMICCIFIMQLSATTEALNIGDSSSTQREIDAYKERYLDPDILDKKGEAYYKKLLSSDFKDRDHAVFFFNHFNKEKLSEKIFISATNLLLEEIEREKIVEDLFRKGCLADLPTNLSYITSENYGMYHFHLCELVGKSGVKTLLPALVKYCPIPKVLINFGDAAVDPVINTLLISTNPIGKMNAISILGEMLKPKQEGYVALGETRKKIKDSLIEATSDKANEVRQRAVRALGDSWDQDVIPLLEEILNNDPYCAEDALIPDIDKEILQSGKVTRYPVRNEAEKALKKLRGVINK